MVKRLVVAVVGLVGVVVIALGVASATLWRADDVLVADLRAGEPLVVTDPGVLELAADEVTVRAEADGPVVLAIGRDTDVTGWLGDDPHQRVTGLAGWHALAVEDVAAPTPTPTATGEPTDGATPAEGDQPAAEGEQPAAEGEKAAADEEPEYTVPDPSGSDMWIAEQRGDGEAQITWSAQPGRWSVLAASTDGAPLRVSLAWPQVVTTPWLWPGVVAGSLLVLLSAALLVRDLRRARRGDEAGWTPVVTGPLPVVDGSGAPVQLTRRQLRELAAHGAVAGTGVRAAREEPRREDAPQEATGRPIPVGADGPAPDDAASAPQAPVAPTAPTGVRGALAGVAPATRRALRTVTSRGSADEPQHADTPAAAGAPGPERADRPAWRPTASPATPARPAAPVPAGPSRDEAPTTAVPAASTSWTPSGAGAAPTSAVPAPEPTARPGGSPRWSVSGGTSPWSTSGAGAAPTSAVPAPEPSARPEGSPRWSVGGGGSPWTPAPPPPSSTSGDPATGTGAAPRPAAGHPQGRPAWLGPATGATPTVAASGHRLPPPGAPGSPDAPRPVAGPAPVAPGAPAGRGPATPGAPAPRPGWAATPPAPGARTGRATGPDAPRRPETPRPSGAVLPPPGTPTPRPDTPAAEGPRPAWLRDAPVPTGPRRGAPPEQGGSRADAWRRAWGLPPTDDDNGSQEER